MSPVRTSRVTPGVNEVETAPVARRVAIETSLIVELSCDRLVSSAGVETLIGPRTVTDSATPAHLDR
jgi:hypothetical protein